MKNWRKSLGIYLLHKARFEGWEWAFSPAVHLLGGVRGGTAGPLTKSVSDSNSANWNQATAFTFGKQKALSDTLALTDAIATATKAVAGVIYSPSEDQSVNWSDSVALQLGLVQTFSDNQSSNWSDSISTFLALGIGLTLSVSDGLTIVDVQASHNLDITLNDTTAHRNLAALYIPSTSGYLAEVDLQIKALNTAGVTFATGLVLLIYPDNSGVPGSSPASSAALPTAQSAANVNQSTFVSVVFDFTGQQLQLTAGTNYWLVIEQSITGAQYALASANVTGPTVYSAQFAGSWSSYQTNAQFDYAATTSWFSTNPLINFGFALSTAENQSVNWADSFTSAGAGGLQAISLSDSQTWSDSIGEVCGQQVVSADNQGPNWNDSTGGGGTVYDIGLDFRASSGFVTDPNYAVPVLGETSATTKNAANGSSVTFQWMSFPGGTRDRSASVDPRLAGINFISSTAQEFRITGFTPGTYNVGVAMGDEGSLQGNAGQPFTIDFNDGTGGTNLLHVSETGVISANNYVDATSVLRTSDTDWVANNKTSQITTSSTTLSIVFTPTSGQNLPIAHIRITSLSTPGGPILGMFVTPSDSATFSDTLSLAYGLGIAESTSFSDTVSLAGVFVSLTQSVSDSTNFVDSTTLDLGQQQAVVDSTSFTDSSFLNLGEQQSFSDSNTWGDSLLTGVGWGLSESTTFADAFNDIEGMVSSNSDSLTFNDTFALGAGFTLVEDTSSSWADTLSLIFGLQTTASDTLSVSDSFTLMFGELVPVSESTSFTDTFGYTLGVIGFGLTLSVSDSNAWSDEADLLESELLLVSDSTSFGDSTNLLTGEFFSATDTLSCSDSLSSLFGMQEGPSDTCTFNDSISANEGDQQSLNDAAAFGDSFTAFQFDLLTLVDSNAGNWSDFFDTSSSAGLTINVSDSSTFADLLVALEGLLTSFTDSTTFADTFLLGVGFQISDSTTYADTQSLNCGQQRTGSDSATFSDSFAAFEYDLLNVSDSNAANWNDFFASSSSTGFSLGVSDAATYTDAFAAFQFDLLQLSESLAVSDTLQLMMTLPFSVSDFYTPADGLVMNGGQLSAPNDQTSFTDALARLLGLNTVLSDTSTYTDTLVPILGLQQQYSDLNTWSDSLLTSQYGNLGVSDALSSQDAIGAGFGCGLSDVVSWSDSSSTSVGWYIFLSDVWDEYDDAFAYQMARALLPLVVGRGSTESLSGSGATLSVSGQGNSQSVTGSGEATPTTSGSGGIDSVSGKGDLVQ